MDQSIGSHGRPSTRATPGMVTIRSRCRLLTLRTPGAAAVARVLEAGGVDATTAAWAAAAGQGHVGRARRLATDEQARERRAAVLSVPASLTSVGACMVAADRLVRAAREEADELTAARDAAETEQLQTALGAGGTGRGAAAAARGSVGVVRDLEKRQKARATRAQRDSLDRALIDLAAFYRDVLLALAGSGVARAHPDLDDDVTAVARRLDSAGALRRLEAVLACREAIDLNVKPQIAVEALTASLRLP